MATATTKLNARGKLAKARLKFLDKNVKKSGKNMHLEFKYFELEDIVPDAIKIFSDVGLVATTEFTEETAAMTVFNVDDATEPGIVFSVPYREIDPIISNNGKIVTNKMQALGSSVTYLRRYLWMMVLDIVEQDDIDSNLGADKPVSRAKTVKSSAPVSSDDRKEIKKELTSQDGNATEEEISELKTACKTLLEKDDEHEDFVQRVALKTQGFTVIPQSSCQELTANIKDMIKAYK